MAVVPYTFVDFSPTGEVQAMHREDVFDLSFLGKMKVFRASDIRFDEASQSWGIHLAADDSGTKFNNPVPEATGFASYAQARDIEVHWLETARGLCVAPDSTKGILALEVILHSGVHG